MHASWLRQRIWIQGVRERVGAACIPPPPMPPPPWVRWLTSVLPATAARLSGVLPRLFSASTSAPLASSILTMSASPWQALRWSAVSRKSSFTSTIFFILSDPTCSREARSSIWLAARPTSESVSKAEREREMERCATGKTKNKRQLNEKGRLSANTIQTAFRIPLVFPILKSGRVNLLAARLTAASTLFAPSLPPSLPHFLPSVGMFFLVRYFGAAMCDIAGIGILRSSSAAVSFCCSSGLEFSESCMLPLPVAKSREHRKRGNWALGGNEAGDASTMYFFNSVFQRLRCQLSVRVFYFYAYVFSLARSITSSEWWLATAAPGGVWYPSSQ